MTNSELETLMDEVSRRESDHLLKSVEINRLKRELELEKSAYEAVKG